MYRCLPQLAVPLPKSGTLNVLFSCLVSWLMSEYRDPLLYYFIPVIIDCATVGTNECIQSLGWHGNGSLLASLSKVRRWAQGLHQAVISNIIDFRLEEREFCECLMCVLDRVPLLWATTSRSYLIMSHDLYAGGQMPLWSQGCSGGLAREFPPSSERWLQHDQRCWACSLGCV